MQSFYTYDMDPIERKALVRCREDWTEAAMPMSKLSTYVQFKDFAEPAAMVKMNLPRGQRSTVAKLYGGILPIQLEVGRYTNVKREKRLCKLCESGKLEDELHFLFECKSLKDCRKKEIKPLRKQIPGYKEKPNIEILTILTDKEHLRDFTSALEQMFHARQDYVYKPNT